MLIKIVILLCPFKEREQPLIEGRILKCSILHCSETLDIFSYIVTIVLDLRIDKNAYFFLHYSSIKDSPLSKCLNNFERILKLDILQELTRNADRSYFGTELVYTYISWLPYVFTHCFFPWYLYLLLKLSKGIYMLLSLIYLKKW